MYLLLKRIIDFILSLFLLIVTFPLVLIFSIILLFELREFPFYSQKRGLHLEEKLFSIFKLRTLKNRANPITNNSSEDIFLKPFLYGNVTSFASWLRKTGLDELPQILNILFGQMSFIGPRPLMERDLKIMREKYPEYYRLRTKVKSRPGITGLWQLFGDRNKGIKNLLGLELVYEKFKSGKLDYHLFLATIPVVFGAKNSDAILHKQKTFRCLLPFSLSAGFEISLELPKELKEFDLKILEKNLDEYQITIPENWWYVSDSYKSQRLPSAKIIKIDSTNDKKDVSKSA
jgi:lipopolysaccharide/colanic/teichoic acid biosynthesis glycosyltransferase